MAANVFKRNLLLIKRIAFAVLSSTGSHHRHVALCNREMSLNMIVKSYCVDSN